MGRTFLPNMVSDSWSSTVLWASKPSDLIYLVHGLGLLHSKYHAFRVGSNVVVTITDKTESHTLVNSTEGRSCRPITVG